MILVDSVGKFWAVMISASGELVTEAVAPQPATIVFDPTGGKWQLSVSPTGTLVTTKIA